MEISVKVPDELAAQAKARGLRIEEYVQELLAQLLDATFVNSSPPRTEAEVRDWLSSMARFSEKIPPLPETISRDWIYQEHD
jgi:hypothetical protein